MPGEVIGPDELGEIVGSVEGRSRGTPLMTDEPTADELDEELEQDELEEELDTT